VIWDKNQGSAGRHLTAIHEYVMVYAKKASLAMPLVKEKPAAKMMIEKADELKKSGLSYADAQKHLRNGLLNPKTRSHRLWGIAL